MFNPKRHILKTWLQPFQAVWDGVKTFEVRKNDRNYESGDQLLLREYDPTTETYTGREIACWTPFVLQGGQFGLPDDTCVMSLMGCIRNEMMNGGYKPLWAEERGLNNVQSNQ